MNSVRIVVPAKEGSGGVILPISLTLEKGPNQIILENVVNVGQENKASIQRALLWAEHMTGKALTQKLTIESEEKRQSIEGRSWELHLTLGLASLLSGTPLRKGLTGTGALGEGGSIKPVAFVPEKISAAREAGYSLFLVSADQKREPIHDRDITIIPVSDIRQAWDIARPWEVLCQS